MADRPILFSAPMVRALLDGTKTQTRRVLRPQPTLIESSGRWKFPVPKKTISKMATGHDHVFTASREFWEYLPTGSFNYNPGDRLYVREAHAIVPRTAYRCSEGVEQVLCPHDDYDAAIFRCGWDRSMPKWRPGIHMPRWASRLTLTVTEVRVERLQNISEADAIAEGCPVSTIPGTIGHPLCQVGFNEMGTPIFWFRKLWNSLNAERGCGWDVNPWVTATTFTIEHRNIDEVAT